MTDSTGNSTSYVVATIKPWNIAAFHKYAAELPGRWSLICEKEDLSLHKLRQLAPRYVFFPHWSWIVPDEILNEFECVCFHMTDVPYGRGGSPLQNLIQRGHKETKLTALRMESGLDTGPVYGKTDLSLSGPAHAIYKKMAELCYQLVRQIVTDEPEPVPQKGAPVTFTRRTPDQSRLPADGSLAQLYDHIRMLDAPTYPRATLDHGGFVMEFSDATLLDDEAVEARVRILPKVSLKNHD